MLQSRLSVLSVIAITTVLGFLLAGAKREVPITNHTARGQETQIVVQWLDDTKAPITAPPSAISLLNKMTSSFSLERVLETNSNNLYWVDGDDIGSGTYNIYLFARDPEAAVRRVIELFEDGRLRPGMRIGVAEYNAERTDWTYRPAFPPGLDNFNIMYR